MRIVYWCPNCKRWFDSPTVCSDGTESEPVQFGGGSANGI